jgi:hypothetical protein
MCAIPSLTDPRSAYTSERAGRADAHGRTTVPRESVPRTASGQAQPDVGGATTARHAAAPFSGGSGSSSGGGAWAVKLLVDSREREVYATIRNERVVCEERVLPQARACNAARDGRCNTRRACATDKRAIRSGQRQLQAGGSGHAAVM